MGISSGKPYSLGSHIPDFGITCGIHRRLDFALESERVQTFTDLLPKFGPTAEKLAHGGFFHTRQDGIMQCFSCELRVVLCEFFWEDNAWVHHALSRPKCAYFVTKRDGAFVERVRELLKFTAPSILPAIQSFFLLQARVDSYKESQHTEWPVKPAELARNGFYYLREGSRVRCFSCFVTFDMSNWQVNTSATLAHARWSRSCSHLAHDVGMAVVEEIQQSDRALVQSAALDALGVHPMNTRIGSGGEEQMRGKYAHYVYITWLTSISEYSCHYFLSLFMIIPTLFLSIPQSTRNTRL